MRSLSQRKALTGVTDRLRFTAPDGGVSVRERPNGHHGWRRADSDSRVIGRRPRLSFLAAITRGAAAGGVLAVQRLVAIALLASDGLAVGRGLASITKAITVRIELQVIWNEWAIVEIIV